MGKKYLAYDSFYKAYIGEDFELTIFKSCAKIFNTKKEIKYNCKVMKIPSKDLKIVLL